jgi:hypothetical protein
VNTAKKPRKTIREHFERLVESAPQITLVPSTHDAAEQHQVASETRCGATSWQGGEIVGCELLKGHGGDHACVGRSWRPRSGDAAIGEPGSEPTA